MAKLAACGLNSNFLRFFQSYLLPRNGTVLVHGSCSNHMALDNTILQGTVLGPPLWNIFFKDVERAATLTGAHEAKYADDLTNYKCYSSDTPNDAIRDNLKRCQVSVH